MDTEERLKSIEDRIDALETMAADAQAKIKAGFEALRKHPLFGQMASQFGKFLG